MSKFAAKGAILKITVATVLTPVPNCGDISINLGSVDRIDVTTHDSAGSTREYLNTWLGEGEISTTLKYDPANATHEAIRAALNGAAVSWSVILPDAGAATFAFNAHVTAFSVSAAVDGSLDASVTIKTTGAITFTA